MEKRLFRMAVGCGCLLAFLCGTLEAQDDDPNWRLTGADAGQIGSKKSESILTPDNITANFKLLWKLKLGDSSDGARSFSEPLLAGRQINGQGFKDIAYWSSSDTLYAVDYELGSVIWKKHFDVQTKTDPACGASSLSILMEPPVVINFRARRRPPGTPRPPDPPIAKAGERRLGVSPGGGYFGFKGVYVLTSDGMLHEQVMSTGTDFAPPVKFLPTGGGSPFGMNFSNRTIYTATGRDCGGVPNGLWAVDLSSTEYPVASYATQKVKPLALTGPVVTPDGTAIVVTGPGTSDPDAGIHAGSVVAVGKDMKVKDWYTPEGGMANLESVSPISFAYKEKQLVVTPGKDGSVALLDAGSLGGADHHTPLYATAAFTKPGEKHGWDGFAAWDDKDGTFWVFASFSTGITWNEGAAKPTNHGGIAAFKLEDANGKLSLTPVWVSADMINPAPPRVANGIVIALAGGDATSHAKLHVLNGATGAELYSSKDEISNSAPLSGVSVADGHAFFTDRDNVLYSFGIAVEH